MDASKAKIAGVVALFVVVGIVLAWRFGVFSSPPKPDKAQQAQFQQQLDEQVQQEQKEAASSRQRRTNAGG
ncbi:MAG: hypothetical protein IPJ41_12680 [Phycisphaerales bacterium]|nr:hypothetical protein [Phycisphaerales bacterium]